ncbi:uncharacterized protein [Nicotiana sylvestris]|uniref:Myb-like protein D n=1 Tax=Nicotiana sylvestris TaxID=4096 RepID=A0A1U7VPV9_NICSY|nr:PREDICTED: myb-like protein D [Nicotiana sylvestris]
MWLQKWSPDFKPAEDLPIAPVWALLPGLPFHMHTWNYVKQVVSAIGTPFEMDLATRGRTRPSIAKVRVEIDLLKDQPNSVYVGQIYDNAPQKGFMQKIEFEGVPKYCKFCRKLGHNMINCRALERKRLLKTENWMTKKLNAENKGTDLNNKKEVYEKGKAINNGQDRDSITQNQLKRKNGNESDNYQQKHSSNIRGDPGRILRRANQGNSLRRKLKRKIHNKEINLALQNLNQEGNLDMAMSVQKQLTDSRKGDQESNLDEVVSAQRQSTNYRKGEQVGADHNKAPLSSSSSKQEHNDYNSNSDNKEDQQESIHDNDSQNENAELENRKKEKKA